MKVAVYFYVLLFLSLLAPHVEGWYRWPWFILFCVALWLLLWDGLPREEEQ